MIKSNSKSKTSLTKRAKNSIGAPQSSKLEVLLLGSSGRMGLAIQDLLADHPKMRLAAAVNSREIRAFDAEHTAVLKTSNEALSAVIQGADVIIDFSHPSSAGALVKALDASHGKTVLIATTGLSASQKTAYKNVAKKRGHKLLLAGNTSQGIATLAKIATATAHALARSNLTRSAFDVEIIETHHRMKADAPSGTALLLAEMIQSACPHHKIVTHHKQKRAANTIGIHSVRGGGIFGEHEVRFIGDFEEVCLSHRSLSRSLFADGALKMVTEIVEVLEFGTGMELQEYLMESGR